MRLIGLIYFLLFLVTNAFAGKPEIGLLFSPGDFEFLNMKAGPADPTFTVSPILDCINTAVVFTQANPVNSNSWFWDFGSDAVPQTSSSPVPPKVYYNKPGLKTATLKVGNGNAFQTKSVSFTIKPAPNAGLIYSGAVNSIPTTLIFTGNSCDVCIYNWNFGDTSTPDNISVKSETTHTFNYNGNYLVTLKMTDTSGCSATSTQVITISNGVSNFNTNFTITPTQSTCVNNKVLITDMSLMPEKSRQWYFGSDAVPQFSNNTDTVSVFWKTQGEKKVVLVAGYSSGSSTEHVKTVTYLVTDYPDASFTYTGNTASVPATINFKANESNGFLYSWDFGDSLSSSNTANSSMPAHKYTASGIYTVTLAISHNGCISYFATNIYIGTTAPAIIPAFTVKPTKNGCQSPSVLVTDVSSGAITSYAWQFGASATPSNSTGKGPFTITYSSPGAKTIGLTIGNGLTTQSSKLKIKLNF